jgi:hypothetical protein
MDLISKSWSQLVANADALNFATAFLVFLVGIAFWSFRIEPVKASRTTRNALEFWILQWLILLVVYALRFTDGGIPNWLQVALVDIQSLLLIGFSFTYMMGDRYRISALIRNLLFIAVVLVPVEWLLGMMAASTKAGSIWRYGSIAPSALLSLVALFFFAQAFLLRYGWFALPLSMTSLCYAFLQWPIYTSVVVRLAPDRRIFLALAIGKLILGGLFYIYFFTPLPKYEAVVLPDLQRDTHAQIQAKLLRGGKAVLSLLVAITIGILGSLAFEGIRDRLGNQGAAEHSTR